MSTSTHQATDAQQGIDTARWRIDPTRSSVEFQAPGFWGLVTVKGRFERYDGTLDLRCEPAIEMTIEAASLDTKNKMRDKHLRGEEFFDAENHPEIRFVSDSASLNGERLKVHGRLYAAGKSMPLDLNANLRRVGDELEVEARTRADHRELGMTHSPLGMVRTPTELIVHGRLVREAK
jgi:polyisoprenoid-binding protein YceI